MKKIISILSATLIIFNTVANAVWEKNGCSYTFTVDADKNETVTMMVVKAGCSTDDENIMAVKEAVSESNSVKFDVEFENDVAFEGDYTVFVVNNNTDMKTTINFTHALDSTIEAAALWLDSESSKNEILSQMQTDGNHRLALKAMNVNFECYDGLQESEKEAVVNMFLEEKNSDDLIGLMNKCIGTIMMNNNYDSEKALICYAPEFENVAFRNIKDTDLKSWINDLIKNDNGYKRTVEIKERYDELCILYKFKKAKFSEFYSLFLDYGKKLGIDGESIYLKYISLKGETLGKAGDALFDVQNSSAAKNTQELVANLTYAYSSSVNKPTTGGGSSTGGGSGSGNKYSSAVGVGGVSANDKVVENSEKPKYKDIDNVEWAKVAIENLSKKGIVSGDGNGYFRPFDNIKREEFAKLLVSAVEIMDNSAKCEFKDVKSNTWYYPYVASAFNAGIVNGISDEEFGIGRYITRQEMASMTARCVKIYKKVANIREGTVFSDHDSIAEYAREDIDTLYRMGIMSGTDNNLFEPTGTATRAQAALVIYNLIK